MTEESVTIEQPERSKDAKMRPHHEFLGELLAKLETVQNGLANLREKLME